MNAFDGDSSTVWVSSSAGGWLKTSYSPAVRAMSYSVTGPGPLSWSVQGSYDGGTTWVLLDAQDRSEIPLPPQAVFTKNLTGWYTDVRFECDGLGPCQAGDFSVYGIEEAVTLDVSGAWAGDASNVLVSALQYPTMPLGYRVVSDPPLFGWTLYGQLADTSTWIALDNVPYAEGADVSLGIDSAFQTLPIVSIALHCTEACSISQVSLLGIPEVPIPWISQPTYYGGTYIGNTNTAGVAGEYLQLNTAPNATHAFSFATASNGTPSQITLLASTNGWSFDAVYTSSGPFAADTSFEATFANTNSSILYSSFRLVCNSVTSPDSSCWLSDLAVVDAPGQYPPSASPHVYRSSVSSLLLNGIQNMCAPS